MRCRPVLPGRLLMLLLVSELIQEHISKIRVIILFRSPSKFCVGVWMCVCQCMWRIAAEWKCEAVNLSKSFAVYLYILLKILLLFSLFLVVGPVKKWTSAAVLLLTALYLFDGQLQNIFLLLLQPGMTLLAFSMSFKALVAKFSAEKDCCKQLVISPVACFGATIYWPGNNTSPVCCSIGFKVGNLLAVIQLACCHPPAKLWHSAVCSPGTRKWITFDCVGSRKMSRGDTSVSASSALWCPKPTMHSGAEQLLEAPFKSAFA